MTQVPALDHADVHVWRADGPFSGLGVSVLRHLLDPSETSRAAAFHVATDRERYVTAHGILRVLLAAYTGIAPEAIRYDVGTHGKPRLAARMATGELTFNMSHTHDVIVIAFARGREVGVDVERWAPEVECLDLARQFLSAAERAALAALPLDAQRAAFFRCWSRKEAYVKATGLGVSHGLDHFDVALSPDADAALLADRSAPEAPQHWRMCDLEFAPGHSGAVVAAGADWQLQRFRVTEALLGG